MVSMALHCLASSRFVSGNHFSGTKKKRTSRCSSENSSLHRSALPNLLTKLEHSAYKESPLNALRAGRWVKLICGASFEDVAEVRNLSVVYTLAGVDCIDCAADEAVVRAVLEGVHVAKRTALGLGYEIRSPWLMVSINDDEDPHFRKAEFNPALCPSDCPRPCERVCPASAISGSVIAERCYGCGRCIPVCPVQNIEAKTYVRSLETVSQLLSSNQVDAVEVHTGAGHLQAFDHLIRNLSSALQHVKLVAVSVPDLGDSMVPAISSMYESMRQQVACPNLWQLDGRPMSGDIGKGATRAAVALAARVAARLDRPPGFLQLAGGTNAHTIEALKLLGLEQKPGNDSLIAGIAFGGYARKIVSKMFKETDSAVSIQVESHPELLHAAVYEAGQLVWPIKLL